MGREFNRKTEHVSNIGDFDRVKMGVGLREARKYLGLSQEFVAHHLGIPRTALSQIENGRRKVDALELRKISELYKLPVSYFTGEISTEKKNENYIAQLARSVTRLSERDRLELSRFVDYLHARAQTSEPEDS